MLPSGSVSWKVVARKGGGGRGERKRGREGREARALGEYLNYGGRWERFNINLAL